MYDFDPLVSKVLFELGFQVSIVLFRLSNSLPVGNIEIVSSLATSYFIVNTRQTKQWNYCLLVCKREIPVSWIFRNIHIPVNILLN